MGVSPLGHGKIRGAGRWRRLVPMLLAAVAITAALVLTAGCDDVLDVVGGCDDETIEIRDNSFTVGDSPRVVARTSNGAITVNVGSDNEVRVEATLRVPDKIEYSVKQEGDTITIEARAKDGGSWKGCMMAEIVVTAPANTDVDLRTSNGAVELTGIEGTGSIETSNGRIELIDVKGEFDGRTSNGQVRVRDAVGEFDMETSNGAISFSGELTAGGRNRMKTSNGKVDVELLGTPSVSLEASTSNGEITTDLPLMVSSVSKSRLVGTIGDGEADLDVSTSNGDVSIK